MEIRSNQPLTRAEFMGIRHRRLILRLLRVQEPVIRIVRRSIPPLKPARAAAARLLVLFLLLGTTASGHARVEATSHTHRVGAVAAGSRGSCVIVTPTVEPVLEWVGEDPETEVDSPVRTLAAGPDGPLGIIHPSNLTQIARIRRGLPPEVLATLSNDGTVQALSVAADGRMFVLIVSTNQGNVMQTYDRTGALLGSQNIGGDPNGERFRGTSLDLAADQCTLFFVENYQVIRRLNACTGTFLPDFATLAAVDVRILPDGGVLVARGDHLVRRLNAAGTIVRSYSVPGAHEAAGLARNGQAAWVADAICSTGMARARLFDLVTGEVLFEAPLQFDFEDRTSIVALDAWTAALGATAGANVPTLAETTLALLAALLAVAAVWKLNS